jgi:lipopolysaccharide transport system permease protein
MNGRLGGLDLMSIDALEPVGLIPRVVQHDQPAVVIEQRPRLFDLGLGGLWEFRELLYFLLWRDVKIRYKQTVIGVAWSVLQPLANMLIFSAVFGFLARIPSDGVPYPIFAYAALLPWTYFAQAVTSTGNSLVGDAGLIRKVYFPRLIIPLASVVRPLIDFVPSLVILLGMMMWYGMAPTWRLAAFPAFLLLAVVTALAVGLWLSALNVRYRDVGYTIPFLVQCWMFASPIVYPASLIPERWQFLYSLNPVAGIIGGFRWSLLGTDPPRLDLLAASTSMVLVLLLGGLVFFRHLERSFADVI